MTEGSQSDLLSRLIVNAGEQLRSTRRQPTMAFEATQVLHQLGIPPAPRLDSSIERALDATQVEPVRHGRYLVLGELGHGSAGEVFEAYDPELRRSVALKVLREHHTDPEVLERFVSEAQITAQLEHPGIVPVHDLGITDEGRLYFVMKCVRGHSLFRILGGVARREPEIARVWTRHKRLTTFVQICRAAAYAHDRGVVHRDLKPSNLMFGAFGEALVMDWGISRITTARGGAPIDRLASHRTQPGQVLGTIGYMSPEQTLGAHDELGPASDVWSLGVILYESLTVRRAYKGSLEEVSERVRRDSLRTEPADGVPEPLGEIIERATRVRPGERYSDAGALGAAVDAYLEDRVEDRAER